MPETTTRVGLKLPLGTENFTRAAYKENLEIIESKVALKKDVDDLKTVQDKTYYVRIDGNDNNTGLANNPENALKTIQAAINKIPQVINHYITIFVQAGTYTESIVLQGYTGKGRITIYGDSTTPDNVIIDSLEIRGSTNYFYVSGFKLTSNSTYPCLISACINVDIAKIKSVEQSSYYGVMCNNSMVSISSCEWSNKFAAIYSQKSIVISNDNSGNGNTYGLYSSDAGTIGKSGIQPSGSVAEYTRAGGAIR